MERVRAKWHQNHARAFVLETQDESFNECNTPVLANGTEAECDMRSVILGSNVRPDIESWVQEVIGRASNYIPVKRASLGRDGIVTIE